MSSLLRYNSCKGPGFAFLLSYTAYTGMAAGTVLATEVVKDPTMPLFNLEQGPLMSAARQQNEEKKAVSLVLQGIVIKSGKKFAVINGQVLKPGQSIEGYKLTQINADGVELRTEGEEGEEELSLTLHKVNIKFDND